MNPRPWGSVLWCLLPPLLLPGPVRKAPRGLCEPSAQCGRAIRWAQLNQDGYYVHCNTIPGRERRAHAAVHARHMCSPPWAWWPPSWLPGPLLCPWPRSQDMCCVGGLYSRVARGGCLRVVAGWKRKCWARSASAPGPAGSFYTTSGAQSDLTGRRPLGRSLRNGNGFRAGSPGLTQQTRGLPPEVGLRT